MSSFPIIQVQQGQLKGVAETTTNGFKFNSFMGIPYAQPPLGNLRFQAPQPVEQWQGIRDATKEGGNCFCFDPLKNSLGGSEDCLYLNVYTPVLTRGSIKPKAVLFWIHGGAYINGSGSRESYGPEFLIECDIVVVTINYRLGFLGFLSLDDKSLAPSNVGLRDQAAALKWVNDNIQHFRGDPKNITIAGGSAGSASVQLMLFSPLTKGLFHKAIMQSGSALAAFSFGQTNGITLCSALGKQAENEVKALKILQSVTVEELIMAQLTIPDLFFAGIQRQIGPVVEGYIKDAYLPDQPETLLASGTFHKVPVMIGYNSAEGTLLPMVESLVKENLCPSDLEECIPFSIGVPRGTHRSQELAAKIKEYYFGKDEACTENKEVFSQIFADTMFTISIYETVEETLKHSQEKVFLYKFSLECDVNQFQKMANINRPGVTHGEEVFHLFKHSVLSAKRQPGSIEHTSIERMTKWWSNFVKYGDPNGIHSDALLQPTWANVDANNMFCYEINKNNNVLISPEEKCVNFWKSIKMYAKA